VIGDLVELVAPECLCGRPFRTVRWVGRVRHLLAGRSGPIATVDLDAALGAPTGVRYLRLTVTGAGARVDVVGERDVVDAAQLRGALAERLSRRVSLRFVDSLDVAPKAKLLRFVESLDVAPKAKLSVLQTEDRSAFWNARYLGV
jgi:hypothetical protein